MVDAGGIAAPWVPVNRGQSERFDYWAGLLCSVIAHFFLAYICIALINEKPRDLGEPEVYSITLEGGKNLGGISQVPDKNEKTQMAPPKQVTAKELPKEISTPEKIKEVEPEIKDAEVSLAETKPTPMPTAVPKKTVAPTPAPKKTAVPTKAPTPAPKQPSKAEIDKEYQKTMQRYRGESAAAGGQGFGAARTGGQGTGGGALRPPEFFKYRDILEAYVKSGWRWVGAADRLKARVMFDIAPDGAVSNVQLVEGSGNREFDESVLRAVYKASPVPKPPTTVYEFFKSVRIWFEPE